MKKRYISFIAFLLVFCLVFASCSGEKEQETTTNPVPVETTKSLPQIDDDVPQSLKSFYNSTLPGVVLKSGVKNPETGEEISCTSSMLQKAAFVDFDSDGVKEIVLLYDISEEAGQANMDVAVFLDERDSQAGVVYLHSGAYGISDKGESWLLSYNNNNKVCLVHVVKYDSCEAILVQEYGSGGWTNVSSAYHHISDHDSVKLESDSYYVDTASGGLFNAVTGNSVYSVEKFRNFRMPAEAFDVLINNFSVLSILP